MKNHTFSRLVITLSLFISVICGYGCGGAPEISISSVEISPVAVAPGQLINIEVIVANTGQKGTSEYPIILIINDTEIETKVIDLDIGEDRIVSFGYIPQSVGLYTIEIGNHTAELNVVDPAHFSTGEIILSPLSPKTNQEIKTTVEVKNDGGLPGTFSAVLIVNETEISSQDVIIEPGQSVTVESFYTPKTSGTHVINFCGVSKDIKVERVTTTTTDEPEEIKLKAYTDNHFYYQILYPSNLRVKEQESNYVIIDDYFIGRIFIHVDRLTVYDSPENYYYSLGDRKEDIPYRISEYVGEIEENDEIIGYKFHCSNIEAPVNWTGQGMVIKKGNFGFFVAYTTPQAKWDENKEMAIQCLDSFTLPTIVNGSYTNSELGISLELPDNWSLIETGKSNTPLEFYSYTGQYVEHLGSPIMKTVSGELSIHDVTPGTTAEEYIVEEDDDAVQTPFICDNADSASEYSQALRITNMTTNESTTLMETRHIVLAINGKIYHFTFRGIPGLDEQANSTTALVRSLVVLNN